ncbi:MAG: serine/threonine-protein kinase [Anaerolineaceae bacterium]|nr:serine/threonine-protein kinase [Anaerolineaceae bacterium]
MGSVYLAKDLHFPTAEKLVAVKEMINQAPDPLVRQTIVRNFEREANILVTLSHPSIPQIFDYFTHEQRSYLVLEYIHGKDLEAVLQESKEFIDEAQIVAWAIELCDVLQYLHTYQPEPIIFRDMKPSNVMIDHQKHIFLIDFGIAKTFRIGQKGTMIGTEGYSPPEQYRGEATPLADIYSMGATLHHLLTKHDPRLEAPFTFSERPIRTLNPAVSIELEAVINTALQYEPKDRFQSAAAMKEALLMAAKKTGILSSTAIWNRQAEPQDIEPVWTFDCEDEIRGSAVVHNGVVFVGCYDNNLYALRADDGQFLWKFATEGAISGQPRVDNGVVYFGAGDNKLYAISVRNGRLFCEYTTEGPIRSSPRIAQGHVFVASEDGFLHAVNITSTRRTWRIDLGEAVRSTPFITKDFIYLGAENGEVICANFGGDVRWRFNAKRSVTSSPIVADDVVYFTSLDSAFYALDAKSGWGIWKFRMSKGSASTPAKYENRLFFGSADGNIYCVEDRRAKEVWRFSADDQVSGSPTVYNGEVFCGAADNKLYCLDQKTGRLQWKSKTQGAITSAPYIEKDVLYIGSTDRRFYALPV